MGTVDHKLRIMLLNPVGAPTLNDGLAKTAREYKNADTHITVASLASTVGGSLTLAFTSIRCLVYAEMVRACLQARAEGYDALIIGCFYDPLLKELRQISGDMLIIGAGEAVIQTASRMGSRYSVLTPQDLEQLVDPLAQELLETGGAVSYRPVEVEHHKDLTTKDGAVLEERLLAQGRQAVDQDAAGVVVLGCTMWHTYAGRLTQALGVPVIDPLVASIKSAELSAQMGRDYGWRASYKPPVGVVAPSYEQLDLVRVTSTPYQYSGRIEVE